MRVVLLSPWLNLHPEGWAEAEADPLAVTACIDGEMKVFTAPRGVMGFVFSTFSLLLEAG